MRFIKGLDLADKITDCIPIVSSVKNIGILLYQLAHKVDRTANPVNTSRWTDLKIHVLSKGWDHTWMPIVPFFGNFIVFVRCVMEAFEKKPDILGLPSGYLGRAITKRRGGIYESGPMQFSHEVVSSYLARNPNCAEEKLAKNLDRAAREGKADLFTLILNARESWSAESVEKVLKSVIGEALCANNPEIVKIFLQSDKIPLTEQQAQRVFHAVVNSRIGRSVDSTSALLSVLFQKYPDLEISAPESLKGVNSVPL